MDRWHLFCARCIIFLCVVLFVLAESSDDKKVKKREVHRIVLKSSRKPRSQHHHHNRHHNNSSKEHRSHGKKGHHKHGGRSHKGHKREEHDHHSQEYDSDERSRENINDHSYESSSKFRPISQENVSSFYGSQEDRSFEEKAPPRKHKSHHKSKPRRPVPSTSSSASSSSQPFFSQEVEETRIAPFKDHWVPLVSSETTLFSPAQLPQLAPPSPPPPALLYNTRPEYEYRITKRPPPKKERSHHHHQHRQQKAHLKIELTTSFPQKVPHPVFYETPDYPILGRPFPPNFHQTVLESSERSPVLAGKDDRGSGASAGSTNGFFSPNHNNNKNNNSPEFDEQPKIKDFNPNYEVHESRTNDFKEQKPRLPFNILAPLIDATRTQHLLSEESKHKNVEITTTPRSEKQQTTVRNDVRPTRNGRGRVRYG